MKNNTTNHYNYRFSVALNYLGSTIALPFVYQFILIVRELFYRCVIRPTLWRTDRYFNKSTNWIDNGYLFSVLFTRPTLHRNFSRFAPSSAVKSNQITI